MGDEINKHRVNVVTVIKTMILRGGLWDKPNCLLYWLTRVAQICFVTTMVTQAIALYMAVGDMEKLFECFSVFTFCGMGFLKLRSLVYNRDSWLRLFTQADSLEGEQLNNTAPDVEYDSDSENLRIDNFPVEIQTYTNRFRSLAFNLNKIYYFTLLIFISSPFMEYGYWRISGEKCALPHILPGWAPLDNNFYGYLVTVSAELIAAVYIVIVQVAFDVTVFGMLIFISGQFLLLKKYSEDLAGRGKRLSQSATRDVRTHYRISRCHRILILLDDSVAELDKLVHNILGIYFFVVTLTLCSVAVRLNSEVMTAMQVVSLVQYTGASLTQLYLFCYYGDMMLQKSWVGMGQGPYASASWCLSPKIRRELLLLAVGMSRVRRLRAGPFNSLDLPSFIQIVRAAYSYYAVLMKQ